MRRIAAIANRNGFLRQRVLRANPEFNGVNRSVALPEARTSNCSSALRIFYTRSGNTNTGVSDRWIEHTMYSFLVGNRKSVLRKFIKKICRVFKSASVLNCRNYIFLSNILWIVFVDEKDINYNKNWIVKMDYRILRNFFRTWCKKKYI